jgi:hypothetical protein
MQTHTGRRRDKTYPYYRCTRKSDSSACGSYINAGEIEAEVWEGMRRLLDDKEYTLGKMRESFDAKRRELSGPGLDAGALARGLKGIETRWVKYQKAYEVDAISVADLAARRTELEGERERIERELERISNREAELERLEAEQAQIEDRIREGWGDLDDASPEKRREVYEDLRLRVEVGEDRRPLLSGWFPVGGGIKVYAEGPEPRRLFNAERPPRHRVSSAERSQRHVGSLTGPKDSLTRTVGSGACPERAA